MISLYDRWLDLMWFVKYDIHFGESRSENWEV